MERMKERKGWVVVGHLIPSSPLNSHGEEDSSLPPTSYLELIHFWADRHNPMDLDSGDACMRWMTTGRMAYPLFQEIVVLLYSQLLCASKSIDFRR